MIYLTEEQAQQIEEIVEHLLVDHPTARHHKACVEALSIIRAARAQADHIAGAGKVIGCAYCDNPLFAGTKCNNCGRVTLAEQAEQQPDYFGLTHDHTWLSIDKKQYDKLKPEGRMACYTAPVRTKDLTDDELIALWESSKECISFKEYEDCARAVIAADREKNK